MAAIGTMALYVKANTSAEAKDAARDRGLDFHYAFEAKPGELYVLTAWDHDKVTSWFVETNKAPYPPGTLIWWRWYDGGL